MRNPHRSGVLASALVLASAACAYPDADIEVQNGDKLSGTLDPGTEREIVRFGVPGGATIRAKASPAKGGPSLKTTLTAPPDVNVTGTEKGAKSSLVVTAPGSSAQWRLDVVSRDGAATGGYGVVVKWQPLRAFETVSQIAASGTAELTVGADKGARVTLRSTKRGGSGATASATGVTGPDAFSMAFLPGAQTTFTAPALGDYVVTFTETAAAAGEVTLRAAVKPPKRKPRLLNIANSAIGASGDDDAVARVVDADGGAVTVPDLGLGGGLLDISGSSVTLPAGALALPTTIVIATAPAITVTSASGAGATVFFGPEGTKFGTTDVPVFATLSIPVDLAVAGGSSAGIDIYVRDSKGRVTLVPPPYDFSVPGYVSFPSSHFSSYRAFARSGGGAANPFTLATTNAVKLAASRGRLGTDVPVLLCDPTDNTVKLLRTPPSSAPTVEIFAGGGASSADGTQRLQFQFVDDPTAAFVADDGSVFIGAGARVFKIKADGTVSAFVGTGVAGYGGDNGPATAAQITSCSALLTDLMGNLFLCDPDTGTVRLVPSASGNIVTEFGTGTPSFGIDGTQAATTTLLAPAAIAFRQGGGFYVADKARIRILNRGVGTNVTFAGSPTGAAGFTNDATNATLGLFDDIADMLVDEMNGRILVADKGNHAIRVVTLAGNGTLTTIVGTGVQGMSQDGAAAPFAISTPRGVNPVGTMGVLFLEGDGRLRMYTLP